MRYHTAGFRRNRIKIYLCVCFVVLFWMAPEATVALVGQDRPALFLPEERQIIREYYRDVPKGGLPPGLAKRGGKLPPGLQKQLRKKGTLPPGLQKKLEPIPDDLSHRLPPLPETWERVIIERNVILLDRRTNRILDIIENVIGLATGR